MTPEQPTPTELAIDLTTLSKIEGTPTPRQVAAKRALYAEHAARELLAALRVAIDVLCPVVRDEWREKEDVKAVLAKYEGVYGEGGK